MATIHALLFGILFISLCFFRVARNAVLSYADKAIEANIDGSDLRRQQIFGIATA